MPGPNSAPNGDRSLTDETMIHCKACKGWFRKREHLMKHGQLRTGKSGK